MAEKLLSSQNHEYLPFERDTISLQTRLLSGNKTLNPQFSFSEASKPERILPFHEREYAPFARASQFERTSYWKKSGISESSKQQQLWAEQFNAAIHDRSFTPEEENLYAGLGIDVNDFSSERALEFFDRYFRGKKDDSLKLFVHDILVSHIDENTHALNYDLLQSNMNAVHWLSHIFGDKSAVMTSQLIDAEAKLVTHPELFQLEPERLNNLLPQEKEILEFIWPHVELAEEKTEKGSQPTTSNHTKRMFHKEFVKLKDPYIYPYAEHVESVTSPEFIADRLKLEQPAQFLHITTQELTNEIRTQQGELLQELGNHELGIDRIEKLAFEVLTDYKNFVKNTYGIDLPKVHNLHIFPVSGLAAQYFNEQRGALAYVNSAIPIMFVDIDVLKVAARRLKGNWTQLTNAELGDLMKRLLTEVIPHEYTHITAAGTLARIIKRDEKGNKTVAQHLPSRRSVDVVKTNVIGIDETNQPSITITRRGRWLHEAITEELVNQWVQSFNQTLDHEGYPQERKVLYELIKMVASEQHISPQEAWNKFVKAHFTHNYFTTFIKELCGRSIDTQGHVSYERPFFTSIVYALMNNEKEANQTTDYSLTRAYITNTLSPQQHHYLKSTQNQLGLSQEARRALGESLAIRQAA